MLAQKPSLAIRAGAAAATERNKGGGMKGGKFSKAGLVSACKSVAAQDGRFQSIGRTGETSGLGLARARPALWGAIMENVALCGVGAAAADVATRGQAVAVNAISATGKRRDQEKNGVDNSWHGRGIV